MQYLENMKNHNVLANKIYSLQNVGVVDSFPETVAITALERCNFNCRTCSQDHKSTKEVEFSALEKIREVLPFVNLINVTGGEPLLYPHLDTLLEWGRDAGCATMIQTNGSLLTERRARHLLDLGLSAAKISCDGATPKTYADIRTGSSFLKLINNIKTISRLKAQHGLKKPRLEFNFVAMASNIHELHLLVIIAANLGVEQINYLPLRADNEYLARESLYFYQAYANEHMVVARETARQTGVKLYMPGPFSCSLEEAEENSGRISCVAPWTGMTLNVSGGVGVCCGGAGNAGNLYEQNFMEMWNDPKRVKIRQTVNTDKELAVCKNCRLNKQNPNNIFSHIPDKKLAERITEEFGHRVDHVPQGARQAAVAI